MRMIGRLPASICLVVVCSVAAEARDEQVGLKVEYDRFKDLTAVRTEPTKIRGVDVNFFYVCPGHTPCRPDLVAMRFVAVTHGWDYIDTHEVIILADGKRITPAEPAKWDGSVGEGYTLEFVSAFLNLEDFLKMCAAESVEIRVGSRELSPAAKDLEVWRLMANRLSSQDSLPPNLAQPGPKAGEVDKTVIDNSIAAQASPAAAASLAAVGHVLSAQEQAELVNKGEASKCAIVTSPPGAEIAIDGNRVGISPLVFVLLRQGDKPRTLTIKLPGYKTVEKKVVPDGRLVPIGLHLERDAP
jgi:hypothetical protein